MKQLNLNLSNNNNKNTKPKLSSNPTHKAFTIIEVVLVLAIAGLIFLMVFIALPALQRNQRDTQRKNDMSRLKTAIDNYKSNNKGQLPDVSYMNNISSGLIPQYVAVGGEDFKDPSGEPYIPRAYSGRTANYDRSAAILDMNNYRYQIWISPARSCVSGTLYEAGDNQASIQYALESGGVYCLNV